MALALIVPPVREGQYQTYWRMTDQAHAMARRANTEQNDTGDYVGTMDEVAKLSGKADRYRRMWRLHVRD